MRWSASLTQTGGDRHPLPAYAILRIGRSSDVTHTGLNSSHLTMNARVVLPFVALAEVAPISCGCACSPDGAALSRSCVVAKRAAMDQHHLATKDAKRTTTTLGSSRKDEPEGTASIPANDAMTLNLHRWADGMCYVTTDRAITHKWQPGSLRVLHTIQGHHII